MAAGGVALTPARRRLRRRERGLGYLLLVPSLVVFGVFVFWPLAHNVYLGFYRNPPFPGLPSTYVGFDQYTDVLTSEQNLLSAQLESVDDRLQQLQSVVNLYSSLGGGWK